MKALFNKFILQKSKLILYFNKIHPLKVTSSVHFHLVGGHCFKVVKQILRDIRFNYYRSHMHY